MTALEPTITIHQLGYDIGDGETWSWHYLDAGGAGPSAQGALDRARDCLIENYGVDIAREVDAQVYPWHGTHYTVRGGANAKIVTPPKSRTHHVTGEPSPALGDVLDVAICFPPPESALPVRMWVKTSNGWEPRTYVSPSHNTETSVTHHVNVGPGPYLGKVGDYATCTEAPFPLWQKTESGWVQISGSACGDDANTDAAKPYPKATFEIRDLPKGWVPKGWRVAIDGEKVDGVNEYTGECLTKTDNPLYDRMRNILLARVKVDLEDLEGLHAAECNHHSDHGDVDDIIRRLWMVSEITGDLYELLEGQE